MDSVSRAHGILEKTTNSLRTPQIVLRCQTNKQTNKQMEGEREREICRIRHTVDDDDN